MRFHGFSKKYERVRYHCHYTGKYRGAAHSICNLRYKTLKEIHVVFYNYYDYHFIIKHPTGEFEEQSQCLEKNTKKYLTFSVPVTQKEKWRVIPYK